MVSVNEGHSTMLGRNGLLSFVEQNYGLNLPTSTAVTKLTDINPKAEHFMSDMQVIGDPTKPGAYLAKELLRPELNANAPAFAAKHEILKYLAQNGVPVLPTVPTREGTPYTRIGESEPHFFEVVPFIQNATMYGGQPKALEGIGEAVGNITQAIASAPKHAKEVIAKRERIFPNYQNPVTGKDFLEELVEYEKPAQALGGELGERVRAILGPTRAEYERILAGDSPTTEEDITHGDIHHANMLCERTSGKLLYVIDWDSMMSNPATLDGIYTANHIRFRDDEKGVTRPENIEAFMRGFTAKRPLNTEETQKMTNGLVRYVLPNVCGILRDIFHNNNQFNLYPLYLRFLDVGRMREVEKIIVKE